MNKQRKLWVSTLALLLNLVAFGQYSYYYQWGLLPEPTLDQLIGESSGDRAFHHVIEMAGYNRPRPPEEYANTLMESKYVFDLLEDYGLAGVMIERFGKTSTWNGLSGTLWEVSPGYSKIADYEDLPLLLVSGSSPADVEAPLIWIGDGSEEGIDLLDLKGKICYTSGSPGRVHNAVIARGAVGLVSFYSPRPLSDPLMIPTGGLRARGDQKITFAFNIPPREGHILRDRLLRGEEIIVRAKVDSRTEELDLQVPTCIIEGTDPDAGEVIISAHIFEGYVKQGANDNISGAAAILEVARVLQTMIDDGRLERPKRSIRFIWVPEFSGTIPWVNAHNDIMTRTLCNINLDMVGLSLSENRSYFVLHRTSYGNSHYVGDVLENYYRYVGETNKMNSVVSGSRFYKRIVSPTGTDDPFYYQVESASGGSDHMVFNDWGVQVPGVLLITWPDPYYHTSMDRPWKCDPTQLKRTVFITAASAYTIASADNKLAVNIAGEVFGNASRRMGHQLSKAIDLVNKAEPGNRENVVKRALADLHGTCLGEQLILNSILELVPDSESLAALIEEQKASLWELYEGQERSVINSANLLQKIAGSGNITIGSTPSELRAASIIPLPTDKPRESGYRGFSGLLGKALSNSDLGSDYRSQGLAVEIGKLANGRLSALEIKHIIDAQQAEETDMETILKLIDLLADAQLIELK